MASPKEVTDATFEAEVINSTLPVMVDLWAPWCGPCQMVSPVVEELAGEYEGRINFAKLNVDENPMTASRYSIRSIPTLLVFKGGAPVDQIVGFRPKAELSKRLDSIL
jgi:thioredoxin 1